MPGQLRTIVVLRLQEEPPRKPATPVSTPPTIAPASASTKPSGGGQITGCAGVRARLPVRGDSRGQAG